MAPTNEGRREGPRERFEAAERALFDELELAPDSHFLKIADPDLTVRVLEFGKGPPLFFVGGASGFAALWAPLISRLGGFRVLALDPPGCGLSDPFDYRTDDLRRMSVALLTAVLDEMGVDSAPVVGSSMGGRWALDLAIEYPNRVTAIVEVACTAALLDSSAPPFMKLMSIPRLNRLLARVPVSRFQVDGILRRCGEREPTAATPALRDAMYRAWRIPGSGSTLASLLEQVLTPRGVPDAARFTTDRLALVPAPTLFVWGVDDTFGSPDIGRRAVESMRQARLETVTGGHMCWLTSPGACAEHIMDFV